MKTKRLFLLASALFGGAILCTPITSNAVKASDVISFTDKLVGEYFSIPEKEITKGSETKKASFKVVSPSGATYFDNQLIANEIGEWKVIYYAMFDGFPEEETFMFNVARKSYSALSSSFYIGKNTEYFKNSGEGINLKLVKGDVFECAEFIDLASLSGSRPFIEIGFSPATKGTRELTELTVRLTDAYDDNNYVDFKLHDPNIKETSYPGLGTVECTFAGQDCMMGMEYIKKDGLKYTEKFIVDNNGYGSYTYISFTGDYYETTRSSKGGPSDPLAYLAFDVSNNHCLVLDKHNSDNDSPRYPDGKSLIADLSRTDYSSDNDYTVTVSAGKHGFTEPFKGFKDKKAKISIFGSGYTGNECGLFINKINNKKVTDVISSTTGDTLAPIIDVDTLGYASDNLPLGKVGLDYNIFDAVVTDDFTSNVNLNTNVYYLNGNNKTYSLPIKNHSFTPKEAGTYLLEYKAVDGSNNISTKSFEINVSETVAAPTLVTGFDELPTTANCGETITLPEPVIGSSSGNAKLDIKVTIGSKEMPVNNNKLLLSEKGNYKVTYKVTDYLGQQTSSYALISVTPSAKPVLYEEIIFYPSLIAGKKYEIDNSVAYDFNVVNEDGPAVVESIVSAYFNKASIAIDNGVLEVPDVDSGSIKFSYIFAGSKGTLTVTKEIPIIKLETNNVKNEDILKYFVSDNEKNVATVDENAVTYTFKEDGTVRFINKIPTHNASFLLNIGKTGETPQNFANRINVYYTDPLDSSKVVKVSFISKGRSSVTSYIQVNDGELYNCSGNFTGNSSFSFSLDTKTNEVICDLVTRIHIDTYLNGTKFEGFHKNSAFVSFEAKEVTAGRNFKLDILTIAGQRCYLNNRGDKIAPVIQIDSEAKHRYSYGEVIETFTATAFDVLQPLSSLTLSITDEDGNPIKLIDGTLATNLDSTKTYSFKMNIYGKYFAVYTSEDGVGNTSVKKIIYVVEDDEKPTMSGTFNKAIKVKANEVVKFDEVKFSDNLTSADKISYVCYAKDPSGVLSRIADGVGSSVKLEYTFTSIGKWTVYWSAQDEIGNISYEQLTVYVE